MKISDLQKKLNLTEEEIRTLAEEVGEPIAEGKNVINKQLAGEIENKAKKKIAREAREAKPEEEDENSGDGIGIAPIMTVKDFAKTIDKPATEIIMQLVKNGFMVNINENVDYEIMELMASELGVEVYMKDLEKEKDMLADQTLSQMLSADQNVGETRAPVVSVMGHVDHGKTSLLDTFRKTNVVDTESGSITQTIGAYQVHLKNRDITFLDTPGHEAFIAMRRRGVHATDIAILVVAANEGVKSQTKEAINHAREAGIPIIVAITKVDLEDSNIEHVKTQLTEAGLAPEEWGGETMMIEVSTKTNMGIEELLEAILLLADVQELKANSNRSAVGTIIESNLDMKLGKVATVLVHTGTLNTRDIVVIGSAYGRIRQLINDHGKVIDEAIPSMPVMITGLVDLPDVGDVLQVVDSEKEARKMVSENKKKFNLSNSDNSIVAHSADGSKKGIRIVLKSDNLGSLEAIENSLKSVRTEDARIKVIRARTGNIAQSDILLAQAVDAIIVGFNVGFASNDVKREARNRKVDIKQYDIIYKLVEELTDIMINAIEPEYEEVELGMFELKKIFLTKKDFMILGGRVKKGVIEPNSNIRIMRNGEVIGEGKISETKKGAVKVKEIEKGEECGIRFDGKFKFEEKDELHFYKTKLIEIVLQ